MFGPNIIFAWSLSAAIVCNQSSNPWQIYFHNLSLKSIVSSIPTATTWVLVLIISHKVYCNFPKWFWVLKAPPEHKGQISSLRTLFWTWPNIKTLNSLGSPSFKPLSYVSAFSPSISPARTLSSGQLDHLVFLKLTLSFSTFMPSLLCSPSAYNAVLYPWKTSPSAKGQDQYYFLGEISHERPRIISLSLPTLTVLYVRLYCDTSKKSFWYWFLTFVSTPVLCMHSIHITLRFRQIYGTMLKVESTAENEIHIDPAFMEL